MKIAISGPMGSGKSTIANMIKSNNDKYIIYSFGGKIKEIAYDLFNMNKNIKDRSLLINIADKMRMIDQDIWAKYIVKQIGDNPCCIIDDLRFHNEQYALRKLGFTFIHLYIDDAFQLKRIKETYKTDTSKHIERRYDISEQSIEVLDSDHYININLTTQHKLTTLLESIINNK